MAFPPIGTGGLGYPPAEAASVMLSAIHQGLETIECGQTAKIDIVILERDHTVYQVCFTTFILDRLCMNWNEAVVMFHPLPF